MATSTTIPLTAGNTYYGVFTSNDTGYVWDTSISAMAAPGSVTWAHAAVALSALASPFTGLFTLATPALPAGQYTRTVYQQAGGSPATSDIAVTVDTAYNWSGTAEVVPNRSVPVTVRNINVTET